MSDLYLVIEPSGDMRWERIEHDNLLHRLHQILDCRFIETVNTVFDPITLIVDDAGKLQSPSKEFNECASRLYLGWFFYDDYIVGTTVVCATREDPESEYHEHDLFGLDFSDFKRLERFGFRLPPWPTDDDTSDYIYGYPPDVWNSFSEDKQIAIQDKFEYDMQHPDQADWFID